MSEQGDVVWADGRSWQKDHMFSTSPKRYWINPDKAATLKELKAFKDFTWLVKDGDLYFGAPPPVKRVRCAVKEPGGSICRCTLPDGHDGPHECGVVSSEPHGWDNVKHDEHLTDAVQLTLWEVFSMDESDDVLLRGCE